MKVTTKIAKNDARLYYVDSKRVSRDKALETAAQNRAGNPFVVEYDTKQNHFYVQGGIEEHVYTNHLNFKTLDIKPDYYKLFGVFCNGRKLVSFVYKDAAQNFAAQIEDAFFNGEHGVKITLNGKISILPAEVSEDNNVGNLTDSALAASNSRLAAFHMNDAVTEIDVSEYAIEIEDAEQAAFEARVTARILADDNLAALYEKAKSQVKCERYESWRSWYFKGKNRTEWELDASKAAACLTRYGLSRWQFAILHDAEVAVIESNGIDETAFDFLPNFEDDELRDYLYDFDERQQLLEDKYEPKTTADTVTEENKIYTLTVYATEDFKGLYGNNTLVKNFDTCWKLHDSGKRIIFTNSWKLERAGKTIATGDGVKDFCRFITCEFDVSERLAEIADARSVDMEICGEHVYFQNGKFMWVMSPKYHASFHAEAGFDGTDHYDIFTADKTGKFTRGNFVTEEEFFNVMVERGGCTIEVDDYAVSPDAQDSAVDAEIKSPEPEITKAKKIAAIERSIARVITERSEAYDELAEAEADDETPQWFIDDLKWQIDKLLDEYWELVRELETLKNTSDTPAPPEVDDYAVTVEAQDSAVDAETKLAEYYREMREVMRDEAQREYEFELLAAFGKQAPEFKRYGSFKPKAAHIDATLQAKTFKPAPDFVEDAIETLDDDMKAEVRAEFEPFKAEYNAAITGIYLDDLSGGDSESGEIIPAAELLKNVIPLALTDFSSTAYRKNPDGNFSRDKAAFKRLEQLERKIFAANGHKIGVDNSGNTQTDDFAEKMAELTADLKEANDACTEACKLREMKRKEFDNACEAAEDAEILVRRKHAAIAKFGQTCAKDLSKKLIDDTLIFSPTMKVINQAGGICKTDFEQIQIFFRDANLTFYVSTDWIFLGEYETPAQVEAVILELKAAIKRGDREFTFPTVEDLSEPAHISEALAEIPAIQKILAQRSLTA